jgi:hypothetical protein
MGRKKKAPHGGALINGPDSEEQTTGPSGESFEANLAFQFPESSGSAGDSGTAQAAKK